MICDYLDPDVDLEAFDKTSDDSIAMLVHSYESRFNGRLDFLTLARCKSIWIDALASAETTEVLGKVLEQFKSHYSVSVFQLISVATACLARFSSNAKPFLLNPRTYFQACSNVEECLAAVKLLSLNQGEFAAKLIRTSRHCWSTDISVLKRYPFLQLNESEFICFDIGLLNQFLIDGIYWLLSETASKLGLDFKAVFGSQVFSRYVEKVIEEFAYSGEVLHKQFYKSPFAVGGNEELGDGIFYADDLACVCEYKSGFLTPQQKYSWNSTSILSGIDQMVCSNKKGAKKGAGQLAQAIETLFSDGKYTCEGRVVDFDCSSEVLPIIIVQDTCLSMSFIQKRVREKFRDFLNPDLRPKVKDLIVLSTSDLELFVELRQNKKEVLIAFLDFLSRNESKLQGDFTTFVYVHYHNHFSSDDSFRKRQGKEHLDEVCEGLGLVKTW